jgi:disulfide bond formation protein DsbB
MHKLLQPGIGNLIGSAICAGMMGFALYAQYELGMEPCPLCIFQRVAVIALGIIFLLAAIVGAGRIRSTIACVLLAVATTLGAVVAGRHVWLQNLPKDEVPACGPGLDFMLETFPMLEVLDIVLNGSGECADVSWRLIGLTMPAWTLIAIVAVGLAGIWVNWLARNVDA